MDLDGKVAIVTGGSGVLGGRICHALAATGCNVAVLYNDSRARGEETAVELLAFGVDAEALHCDVTDREQVNSTVASVVERFGRVDILINNAAYNKWIPFDDLDGLTFEEWNKIISINLTGPMNTIKAVADPMKAQGTGRIVNISSVAGLAPTGSSIAYAVSKAGLNHLTKCMAVGLAPDILVNCIAPGYMEGTKMSAALAPEYRKKAVAGAALQRATDKDDVAEQVVAFCETDSITGQTLAIDAGRVFH